MPGPWVRWRGGKTDPFGSRDVANIAPKDIDDELL